MNSARALADAAPEILANIQLPVSFWSRELKLLAYNPAFAQRFDCFAGQIPLGIAKSRFIEAVEREGLVVHFDTSDHATHSDPSPDRVFFADGSVLQLECWQVESGNWILLCIEITTAQRNERALRKAHDAARAADKSKSRFLRAANHDLRQPLAALKILIYSCMNATEDAERQQALHGMEVSVSIIEDLLGALLNIGQLDAGRIQPTVKTFQIATILERLKVQFDHMAREKGLELRIVNSTATVVSDRALLERILSNFVSNAIRYTEIGYVLVGCRHHGGQLRIHVMDTGIGIAEEFQEDIFQEFFRISKTHSERQHSLGLGLNIARRLADILGHRITLRSAIGRGSDFTIECPIGNIWHSTIGESEISEQIGGEFAGLTCLLLEDDQHVREALRSLLERWGVDVLHTDYLASIESYLRELESPPDIIITDYHLSSGYLGTEIVGQINDILDRPCPAVVVTADTGPELIKSIRAQGFPVLIKPIAPAGLRVMMHNILFEPHAIEEMS